MVRDSSRMIGNVPLVTFFDFRAFCCSAFEHVSIPDKALVDRVTTMFSSALKHSLNFLSGKDTPEGARAFAVRLGLLVAAGAAVFFYMPAFYMPAQAQQSGPVVVQPGAPGKPSKTLPASTRGKLPPTSPANVEFMQGMIMHHAQAVEMTALQRAPADVAILQSFTSAVWEGAQYDD